MQFVLVVPQNKPPHGGVIYDEAVRETAQVRARPGARQAMARGGHRGRSARSATRTRSRRPWTRIAIHRPDEVIISTHPRTASGWLRRDLVERIQEASGLPVEHVVIDLDREGLPFHVTLVVANQTLEEAGLLDASQGQGGRQGSTCSSSSCRRSTARGTRRARRATAWRTCSKSLREAGLLVSGMIGDPDPYTATMNALQLLPRRARS